MFEPAPRDEHHAPRRENTLRALRRALPLQRKSLAKKALAGRWRLENSRDGPYYVLEYTPHYLVLGGLRDKICSSLQLGNVNCMNARYIAMLRDPAKRAFCQYVMKTHMRVALYNDRRTFWKAVTDGMKHTADYAACWDDALGLSHNESSAHEVAWTRAEKIGDLASGRCAPINFHGNLFQAYVLKSAYYYQLLPWFAHFPSRVYVDVLEHFDDDAVSRGWCRGSNSPTSARTATKIRRRSSHWRAPSATWPETAASRLYLKNTRRRSTTFFDR